MFKKIFQHAPFANKNPLRGIIKSPYICNRIILHAWFLRPGGPPGSQTCQYGTIAVPHSDEARKRVLRFLQTNTAYLLLLVFVLYHPLSYFSFQPVLHNWCNKGRGMCYPRMVHIKYPLLSINKQTIKQINNTNNITASLTFAAFNQ